MNVTMSILYLLLDGGRAFVRQHVGAPKQTDRPATAGREGDDPGDCATGT